MANFYLISEKKEIPCPFCGEITKKQDCFWKCPKCGGECWPDESKLAIVKAEIDAKAAIQALRERVRWSIGSGPAEVIPLVPIIDSSARGSRSSGRSRKKKPWKPLHSQRYMFS